MKTNRKISITVLIAMLAVLCLVFASCQDKSVEDASDSEDIAVSEQNDDEAAKAAEEAEKAAAEEAEKAASEKAEKAAAEEAEKAAAEEAAAKEDEQKAAEKKAAENKAAQSKSDKASKDKKSSSGKKKASEKSDNKEKEKEKQKVWVPPVTETRTVTLDTGTRYCNGANSSGGCGASWHGTKDSTYNSWYSHWQDYVKRRTKEEAEKGNVYVCDHIHDDSRWVPDTTTEEVVVQEGYWKEVD